MLQLKASCFWRLQQSGGSMAIRSAGCLTAERGKRALPGMSRTKLTVGSTQSAANVAIPYDARISVVWKRPSQMIQPSSFYSMWDAVARFAQEIRASDFMAEMIRRRDAYGSGGGMVALECATLSGLTLLLQAGGGLVTGRCRGM